MAELLTIIRHADTGVEYSGKFIGATDLPISVIGCRQSELLGKVVDGMESDRLLCSPMLRTRQTLDIAFARECEMLTGLKEIDFGDWEKKSFDELAFLYPEQIDRWSEMDLEFEFPGGESLSSFFNRIAEIGDTIASMPEERITIVTHGGVARGLICHYLGLNWQNYILFEIGNTSITKIKLFGNKGILECMNDTCHLSGKM